jgi:hypothetical protein
MPRHRTAAAATIWAPPGYIYAALAEAKRVSGAWVSEPEPGRVLLEREPESGRLTTFTVDPLPTGASRVTIATDITVGGGLRGAITRHLSAWSRGRACRRELERLAAVVAQPAGADGWSLTVRRRPAPGRARPNTASPAQTV